MKLSFWGYGLALFIMTFLLYEGWTHYPTLSSCFFGAQLLVGIWELKKENSK
jgi:hypothetical protein